MDYITVRELRERSGEVWQRVEAGEEFVVTRNGKPFALLVHTDPQAVEDKLRALRLAQMAAVVKRIQQAALANGSSGLTDADIQTEIDAVRSAKRSTAAVAAEPKPRYARRR